MFSHKGLLSVIEICVYDLNTFLDLYDIKSPYYISETLANWYQDLRMWCLHENVFKSPIHTFTNTFNGHCRTLECT